MTALIALALVVIGVIVFIALRNAQDFSDANEIVPGVPTRAPASWAGAHHPAAKMHRRLRDAVDALRANASLDEPSMASVRHELEQQALAVDDRLVAVNELPRAMRDEPLRQVERAVHAIEQAAASVVDLRGPSLEAVEQGIEAVQNRMMLVETARAELDALPAGSSAPSELDELRARLEANELAFEEIDPDPDGSGPDGSGPDSSGPDGPGPDEFDDRTDGTAGSG